MTLKRLLSHQVPGALRWGEMAMLSPNISSTGVCAGRVCAGRLCAVLQISRTHCFVLCLAPGRPDCTDGEGVGLLFAQHLCFSSSDSPLPVTSRVCFVKFHESESVGVSQHLTNTVFVDRALIVVPFAEGEFPEPSQKA